MLKESNKAKASVTRIFVIDNYDSFTYNIVQALEMLGAACTTVMNDAIGVSGIRAHKPKALVISPGPCTPAESGVSMPAIRELSGELPILGVCLGHQAIAHVFGGRVIRAPQVMHGKTSPIEHDTKTIFEGIPSPFQATRYHSLIVDPQNLPPCLEISARAASGEIMGLRHRHLPAEGVQFHPESILSQFGLTLLKNWLNIVSK